MAVDKPQKSKKNKPSDPKAVNNESLLAKPEKGGTPANDKKNVKKKKKTTLFCE
jgi:hypothetical protein